MKALQKNYRRFFIRMAAMVLNYLILRQMVHCLVFGVMKYINRLSNIPIAYIKKIIQFLHIADHHEKTNYLLILGILFLAERFIVSICST